MGARIPAKADAMKLVLQPVVTNVNYHVLAHANLGVMDIADSNVAETALVIVHHVQVDAPSVLRCVEILAQGLVKIGVRNLV